MMNAVKQEVEKLVQKELESANQRFPMFRSDHEGAAVIVEEIEEAKAELEEVDDNFHNLQGIAGRKELWGMTLEEAIEILEEVKDYIDNMNVTKNIAKNTGLCKRIGNHFNKHQWFYSQVIGLLGQALLLGMGNKS